ncbi:MAG: hypothetical protein ABW019_04730 [Chitinophagaceae bacterium]
MQQRWRKNTRLAYEAVHLAGEQEGLAPAGPVCRNNEKLQRGSMKYRRVRRLYRRTR